VLYNMNCAGGIMKCDVIAAGIVSAAKQVGGVSWRTHGNCAEIVSAAVVDARHLR
jgi:succinyl-CoA synthetase beta subunit